MTVVYTGPMNYRGGDRIDTTMGGSHPTWKMFAPTGPMVITINNAGPIVWEWYIERYLQILDMVPARYWEALLGHGEITLVCFCYPEAVCHTKILVWELYKRYPGRVTYGGHRAENNYKF